MAKLKCGNVDERGREISVGNFVRAVDQKLLAEWDETKSIGSEMGYPETALCDGVKRELGYEDRRQSDWFRGSEKDLKPLLSKGIGCTLCGLALVKRSTRESTKLHKGQQDEQ